jgi:DDE superfamily endonuclease
MRFTPEEIAVILPYLCLDEIDWKINGNGYQPSQTKALAITLCRLAFPLRLFDMIKWFGCSGPQLSVITNVVCVHLARKFRNHLFFDRRRLTMNKMRQFSVATDGLGGSDKVWGWIDGTVQRICRPKDNQRRVYSGYKEVHGYKFQSIITPDGIISSLVGPIAGSRGDWFMFKDTGIEREILRLWRKRK